MVKVKDELLFRLKEHIILEGFRGSVAHGTYEPSHSEDKDLMGIFVLPEDYLYGIKNIETIERTWEQNKVVWDVVYYSLPKYLRLILKQNPNVISLLWLDDSLYRIRTGLGKYLITRREELLSKQCYKSFTGYAYSQLHRMTHPGRSMGAKRKELLKKYGYDTKNASHLIRLLTMGLEVLTLGEVIVKRHDSAMLLEIKRGEWSLEKIQAHAEKLFEQVKEALSKSPLRNKVDSVLVDELCIEITKRFYKYGKENIWLREKNGG